VPTIYVTHDPYEALALADRIAVIDAGSLQQLGLPGDVCQRPANRFVAEFFDLQDIHEIEKLKSERNNQD
jgi:spermidine/putrescine transport system ATP-binding protein